MQIALGHACSAKNQWSRVRGYPPEILVFGKLTRQPGSVVSDWSLPAHAATEEESAEGIQFRAQLARRESARRAFVKVDNDQALRRAIVHRTRPHRGVYQPGESVMIWRPKGVGDGHWQGPLKVVLQEGNSVVWVTGNCRLYRIAPEHVRTVSAMELHWQHQEQQVNPETAKASRNGVVQFRDLGPSLVPQSVNREDAPSSSANREISGNRDETTTIPSSSSEQVPRPSAAEQPDHEPPVSSQTSDGTESKADQLQPTEEPLDIDASQIPVPVDNFDELFVETESISIPEGCAWECSVFVTQKDIEHWKRETQPEQMCFAATAAKRQRAEVKMINLNDEQRKQFQKAKDAEISSWLDTQTVARILRNRIPAENVMRCRWILTWKPVEEGQGQRSTPDKKAKARLVVLGYEDPQIAEIPRDSPTMGRLSRMLLLQLISSHGWELRSFDVKTAFLRGNMQDQRLLGLEPPEEMRARMNLKPTEICQLLKGAYGRVDAPYLWYKEIRGFLESLNFKVSPFDNCVFGLFSEQGYAHGYIGLHVDDGLCGGDQVFQKALECLEEKYPFGSKKKGSFKFTGIQLEQFPDGKITLRQGDYVKEIESILIDRNRRQHTTAPINEPERQQLRALVGSLQYAVVNTRPDIASKLGALQGKIRKGLVSDLIEANKLLHEAKQTAEVCLQIQPIAISDLRFLTFSDASFASEKTSDSHQGMMIMATHEEIEKGHPSMVNPIIWHAKKIQRVTTSTLAAESMALSQALDVLSWVRLYWSWLLDSKCNWRCTDQTLLQLPPAFASATCSAEDIQPAPVANKALTPAVSATDCKSLYDLVTRTATPSCGEFRTLLQAKLIQEHLATGIRLRWVHSAAQLADALTKPMDGTILRECLKQGRYSLRDETEILKARSCARTRLQWLKHSAQVS